MPLMTGGSLERCAARYLGRVLAALGCVMVALLIGHVGLARAGGSQLQLEVQAPTSVLFKAHGSVALTATNPAGQPYGYNLSYRAELPAGISYVPSSARLQGGGSLTPKVINNPASGITTLIFSDVGDLSPRAHDTLDFEVEHSPTAYAVGGEYEIKAGAYMNELPRYLPKFDDEGKPLEGPDSYTASATGAARTKLTALEIMQEQLTYPEGEILRGLHDHQYEYRLTVKNTEGGPTDGVTVNDWLPADVEYLGCGGADTDHTTESPSNPGSSEEYSGSGPITVPAVGGCVEPVLVETSDQDPDGGAESPTGVYTHIQWRIPALAAGETRTFTFRAAVPLRENTTSWPHGEPSGSGGGQAANLDNNSGRETHDGEQILTYANAEGQYRGELPVSAADHLSLIAKDLTTEKATAQMSLADGELTTWRILVHSSEYRYNTGVTVTDIVPNGLCPSVLMSPRGLECEPTDAVNPEEVSSPGFSSAVENADGTWTVAWNPEADPALADLKQNDTAEILFRTRTRTNYWSGGASAEPILAHDRITNEVVAAATANVVCEGDSDCEGAEPPIYHEGELTQSIQDASQVSQEAGGPSIEKQVAAAGSGSECLTDAYVSSIPVFHPGDTVCWRLHATFPTATFTHSETISDFLPASVTFNAAYGQRPTGNDTLTGTTFDDFEAGGAEGGQISWTMPESGRVGTSQVFERVYATTAKLPTGAVLGDLQGNLMKLSSSNTEGESFALRSEADYALQFPELTIDKEIVALNGVPEGNPTRSAIVDGGERATFKLTVTNVGEVEADHAVVIDDLPEGLTCADIQSISDEGTCEGTNGEEHLSWGRNALGESEPLSVPAKGETSVQFEVQVPAPTDPGRVFEDHAGIEEYESATNTGGQYTYIPEQNIEKPRGEQPLAADEAHVGPALAAAKLTVEGVSVAKSHTTTISEAGNSIAQATIGEQAEYEVAAVIPAGTSLASAGVLADPGLKALGLQYVPGSAKALVNGSEAPVGYEVSEPESGGAGTGPVPTVELPAGVSAPTTGSLTVALKFKATVANVEANRNGATITNTGRLSWTNSLGEARQASATNALPLVEPHIGLSEQDSAAGPVTGGQQVEYSLHVRDTGASTASQIRLVEDVASGVVALKEAGGAPLANHEKLANGGEWIEAAPGGPYAGEIVWEPAPLAPGTEATYSYFVRVEESPSASASLADKAKVTAASLPAGEGTGRTAANAPGATKASYEASTTKTLQVQQMTIAKAVQPESATIGQHVIYTLTVTLPAHVSSYDTTVLDKLPDSLDFDRFVSAQCISGCAAAPLTIQPYRPSIGEGPTTLAWSIGEVQAAGEARTVTIEYEADVRATHRAAPHGEVKAPLTLENEARVSYDRSGPEQPFEEATIPTALETSTATVKKALTLLEPKLKLTKQVSIDGGTTFSTGPVHASDSQELTYRVSVKNEGNGAAYGIHVSDALPPTLTEARATNGAATHPWSAGEPHFAWEDESLAPGATVSYEYEAAVVPATELTPNEKIENEAALGTYDGVDETEFHETRENHEGEPITYRTYPGATSEATAEVQLPSIAIQKLAGSSQAEVGQPFTWHVKVTNQSTVAVKDLHIADILPPNWEYEPGSASLSTGSISGESESGSLASGVELVFEAAALQLAPAASATLTYTATPLLGAETTPGVGPGNPNRNTAYATVRSLAGAGEDLLGAFEAGPAEASATLTLPTLVITKSAARQQVAAGEQDSYAIKVENVASTATARNVIVSDTLPATPGTSAGILYSRGSATSTVSAPATFQETAGPGPTVEGGEQVQWKISAIEPGKAVTITVPVSIAAPLQPQTLTNTAEASSDEQTTPVTSSADIETTAEADLAAVKSLNTPLPLVPGKDVSFELLAVNHGPSLARQVQLTDQLPAGTSFVSASSGCSESAGTVTCQATGVETGQQAAFEVVVSLESSYDNAGPSSPRELENTVHVTSATPDPDEANNVDTAAGTTKPQADLSLTKTPDTSAPLDGQEARFTLKAVNAGPSDAPESTLVDELPAGMEYISSSGAPCASSGSDVTCELATLAAGDSTSVELVVRLHGSGVILANQANVQSAVEDPDPANNAGSATVEVAPAADLALEKSVTPVEVKLPGEAIYTLTVANHGPDTAQGAVLSDPLPTGETYLGDDAGCGAEGQLLTCHLGDIADGQSRTIHITAKVGLSLGDQIVTNTARVSSPTGDPDSSNNTASARLSTGPTADISVHKTGPATATVGEPITWTLDVANNGPSTAHEVKLVDLLPAGTAYGEASSSQGSCAYTAGTLECQLGELADGADAHITVTASDPTAGQITNSATVSAAEPDPQPSNNTASATTNVSPAPEPAQPAVQLTGAKQSIEPAQQADNPTPAVTPPATGHFDSKPQGEGTRKAKDEGKPTTRLAHLTLTSHVNRDSARAGQQLGYELTVRNTGKTTAHDVKVCDTLPPHTTLVSRRGGHLDRGRLCFTLSKLDSGKRHSFTLRVRADSDVTGILTDHVQLSAANLRDPKPARISTPVHGRPAPRRESGVTG